MTTSTAVIVSALAACISALSALVTVWNYRREMLNQEITGAKWKKEYFADLLKWSDETLLQLSEALHLCDLDPKRMPDNRFFEARHSLRVKLSAQIDRGRWFFPNYATDQYGQEKHEAFKGFRQPILDGLIQAYQAVSAVNYDDASKNVTARHGPPSRTRSACSPARFRRFSILVRVTRSFRTFSLGWERPDQECPGQRVG